MTRPFYILFRLNFSEYFRWQKQNPTSISLNLNRANNKNKGALCVMRRNAKDNKHLWQLFFWFFFNYVWISFCFFRLDKKKKEILIANELEFNDSMIFWIVFENITDPLFCCCTTDFCDGLPTTTIPYNNNIKILLLTLSFSLTPFSPIFFWTTNKKIVD